MTFTEYVMSRRVTDTPNGDFVADTQTLIRAGRFEDPKTWRQLEFFMRFRAGVPGGVSERTIEAGKRVWRQYQAASKKV
jgi:hypothetical protein